MTGGFLRRIGWFYVATVGGGILVLAVAILALQQHVCTAPRGARKQACRSG